MSSDKPNVVAYGVISLDTRIMNRGGRKRVAYITLALLIVCLIGMFVWFLGLTAIPKLVIPTNPMPTPNAFNTFNEAIAAMKDDNKMDYASQSTHAGRTLDDRPYSLKEKQQLLTENKPVLSLFREGMKQEYMSPNIRSNYAPQPYLSKYRKLARLLLLESQVLEGKGDLNGALQSRLSANEFGNKIVKGGALFHSSAGRGCQSMGQRGNLRLFDRLSTSDAKSALVKLLKIESARIPFSETLVEQKRLGQAERLELFRKIHSYKDIEELNNLVYGNLVPDNHIIKKLKIMQYFSLDKRRAMDEYANYIDVVIVNSKLPYAAHPIAPVGPKDSVNQLLELFPFVYTHGDFNSTYLKMANKLLMLGLALKIYKDVHGKYPDRLSQLVPGILAKLPDDPFALSGTFKYRSGKDKYVLYSVGPDGKDDGGMPIDEKSKISKQFPSSTSRYVPREDSKGDIVLGTNVK